MAVYIARMIPRPYDVRGTTGAPAAAAPAATSPNADGRRVARPGKAT